VMPTVADLLSIYRCRVKMQDDGTTCPPEAIKQFCLDLVGALENEDSASEVEFFCRGEDGTDFIVDGRVLANEPAHEDPKWWRDDRGS
ncbi:MAG: hypothetical protein AAF589_02625, partial [Planctomycetota bacterium]